MLGFNQMVALLSMALTQLMPIDPANLTVTSGHIIRQDATHFAIIDSMRGSYGTQPRNSVEIDFVYNGPSVRTDPLANGEIRRQIGLKLRAQDTCNVVYVMQYIEPTQGIHVSVKNNSGKNTHEQCRDGGYIGIQPFWSRPAITIQHGDRHSLQATIVGDELRVVSDGALVLKGKLPSSVFTFNGPVGIRSDNGNFDVEMRVGQ